MTLPTAQTIWQQVLADMREYFDPKLVKAHLTKSEVLAVEETVWTIGVVSSYSAEELTKKVKGNILGFIEEHDSTVIDVLFVDKHTFQPTRSNVLPKVVESLAIEEPARPVVSSMPEPTSPHDERTYPVLTVNKTADDQEPKIRIEPRSPKNKQGRQEGQLLLTDLHEDVYADTTISFDEITTHKDVPRSAGAIGQGSGSVFTGLNPHNIFESFIVGSSNRVAFAAAQGVAETPGKAYNPLFIYGGVGLGKTHLMQAVGNAIVAKFPHMKVQYFPSEKFTNEFIHSLKEKTTDKFRAQYRALDVILVDDIQFIAGKDSTQEEFFHTFNEIVGRGGHILMTSDRSPEDIPQLEERLVSRFKGGMLVDIGLPDYEMKVAIIRSKCIDMRIAMPDDAVDFLASHIQTNTRELSGTLMSVISKIKSQGWELSLEYVRRAWGEDMTSGPSLGSKNISPAKVIQVVHHYFNIRKSDITGKVRTKNFVLPRQICMYLMKEELAMALEKIGAELGGRDHTTVMHGVGQISEQLSTNDQLRKDLMLIKQQLMGQVDG